MARNVVRLGVVDYIEPDAPHSLTQIPQCPLSYLAIIYTWPPRKMPPYRYLCIFEQPTLMVAPPEFVSNFSLVLTKFMTLGISYAQHHEI